MNSRVFITLAVLAVVALATALLVQRPDSSADLGQNQLFLPTLKAQINDVNRVEIFSGGRKMVAGLSKTKERWVVDEPGGYPADWEKLRQLLADLAAAKVLEAKTDNPDYYERLGVRDIEDEDAGGHLVLLGSEADSWAAIIGERARNREGQYARIEGQAESVLLDKTFNVSGDRLAWLVREIVDLVGDEVRSVVITQPGGERVELLKEDPADNDYTLVNLPEGREVKSAYSVNSLAAGLANLSLDDVVPAADVDFTGGINTVFTTIDDRRITLDLIRQDEKSWLRINAEFLSPATSETEEAGAPEAAKEPGEDQPAAAGDRDPGQWVADLNTRTAGWAYAIPGYKFDTLAKQLKDLLESPEEEEDEA